MIPAITHPGWSDLIKGKTDPELSSFSLKMKINSVRQLYRAGRLDLQQAVSDLHALCTKYDKIYEPDLKKIFN